MIRIEGLAPLVQVFDRPRAVAFYRDLLGFEIVETSPSRGPDDSSRPVSRPTG